MLKQASLVESGQSIDGSREQAQLLHVVVDVQVTVNLSPALSQDLSKLSCLAENGTKSGFKEENETIAAGMGHIHSLFGNLTSLF